MDQAEQLRNIIKAGNVKRSRPLARVITVTSGKGGVGKSNTAINLAIQFRKMGKKVVILDADFGLANIEIMFGAVPKHNLSDLIYQGKNIKDIITWGPMEVGFISGGSGITGLSNLSKDYLTYIVHNLAELDTIADVIIVDTGAGISDAVLEFPDDRLPYKQTHALRIRRFSHSLLLSQTDCDPLPVHQGDPHPVVSQI